MNVVEFSLAEVRSADSRSTYMRTAEVRSAEERLAEERLTPNKIGFICLPLSSAFSFLIQVNIVSECLLLA